MLKRKSHTAALMSACWLGRASEEMEAKHTNQRPARDSILVATGDSDSFTPVPSYHAPGFNSKI